jgi:hypothetical protein
VDSYLVLAQKVLEQARRPLTPREILREAYRHDLVPYHLHGATQHKTLQARLSEHIIEFRDNGLFFRTAPGRFFLRSFINDESIASEFRRPIVARRRARELRKKEVLTVSKNDLPALISGERVLPLETLYSPLAQHGYHYASDIRHRAVDEVAVWSFVVVIRDSEVLTYRQGRYREDRDAFHQRRSVGFYAPVVRSDRSLFDQIDHGLVSSGIETLAIDLDLTGDSAWNELASRAELKSLVYMNFDLKADLLGVVRLDCPSWFEPLTRRLAINDLSWQDLGSSPNHLEDYDPWSRVVFGLIREWVRESSNADGSNRAWSY